MDSSSQPFRNEFISEFGQTGLSSVVAGDIRAGSCDTVGDTFNDAVGDISAAYTLNGPAKLIKSVHLAVNLVCRSFFL